MLILSVVEYLVDLIVHGITVSRRDARGLGIVKVGDGRNDGGGDCPSYKLSHAR